MDDLFAPSDVSWTPVSPKLAAVRRVTAAITFGLLAIAGLLVLGLTVDWLYGGLWLLLMLAGFAWSWRMIGRNQQSWKYAEREDELLVSHGILFRQLVVVPYGRMQFVDVAAGPLERSFGIATVELHTATPATDAKIPGLLPDEASRLRDRLSALGQAQAWGL
ncbi:membrane-flanked domain protein [Kribbella flavida DSM 17836]|uniref:Membrane-flanked domain protein n=1 Tax=Kribbella flavida (strain DSM 17836 / JCM 10339 / NBRC 14399) TaxID=479435 RepID=D2PY81_KRIFD|nr:PH domain-containing protein [Kribbella flavida]ADB35449.1 membrane-flanked domain protein [Kribbella flavida DSM 17836]